MRFWAFVAWLAALSASPSPCAQAEELAPITIAAQAGLYRSLPLFAASENGWWPKAGLQPLVTHFEDETYLLDDPGWDVAVVGPLTALVGAAREGLMTVGIADDESDANVVMARPAAAETILDRPATLKGKTLLLTRDTTAEYGARRCLARWRLNPEDVRIAARPPGETGLAFADGAGDLAALTAPASYAVFERGAGITVCSAKDAGAVIPGALVARKEFAERHPERVARFVATVLHAVAWEKTHRGETLDLMRRYYRDAGIELGDAILAREIETRPLFALDEQLKLLDRSGDGVSTADGWFGRLAAYLLSVAAIEAPPLGQSYLTDTYVKWADADPLLHGLAVGEQPVGADKNIVSPTR